ncbi:hypothetical protein [Methanobrevibacter sp.]|uniref:hypothetical protein n=1 Tax=Methanobrevibacter sp. TaxID=66852 RepID=UPI00388D2CB7
MGYLRISKIILPLDIKSLSMMERICSILIYTVPPLLLAILTCINLNNYFSIVMWILYCILFSPWFYYLLKYERLEKKYKIMSDIRFGNTYEFLSKLMVFSVPGIIITIITITYFLNQLNLGIIISSAFIVPSYALYFRNDVFNDESCIEGEEIIFGYIPTWYGLLSLAVGIYGYFNAFKLSSLTMTMTLGLITLIFQILFVVPDKFNRILSFEVRRKKGCILLLISLITLFFIISMIFSSHGVNFNNIDLSFESIIMKVITWSIAIILAILFARKIKDMNQK